MLRPLTLLGCLVFVSTNAACGVADSSELDGGAADAQPTDIGWMDAGPSDAGPPADATPGQDSGTDDAEVPTEGVEVGTGDQFFIPVHTGEIVSLVAGPQGGSPYYGYHVWIAARVDTSFVFDQATVEIEIVRADTEEVLSTGGYYTLDLTPISGGYEAVGLRSMLMYCCDAENRDLLMRLQVTDRRGKVGRDRRTFRVPECRDPNNPSYDPCP